MFFETFSWSQGMALILFALLGVGVLYLGLTSRPSRRWIKQLQQIEDGRRRQEAEFIASNCFRDWRKP